MAVFYIDPDTKVVGDGLSPESAAASQSGLDIRAGDFVLYRRGSFIRGILPTAEGVYYGAWGEGGMPTFCGSTDASDPSLWREVEPDIWACCAELNSDVGNIVYGEEKERVGATLRWSREELCGQGDFFDPCYMNEEMRCKNGKRPEGSPLLVYSKGNPGEYYSHIECCLFGKRELCKLRGGMVLEGLRFINSGAHGAEGSVCRNADITVRGCDFEFIGGAVWSVERRIRYGNCVEFWNTAIDVTVENCRFYQVYDSCVTHQGAKDAVKPAERFICRGNLFEAYGMAAFEYRDRMMIDSTFENNICLDAGVGFALFGETPPRRSEIWPKPMGHHLFLWRIDSPAEGGSLSVKNNIFGDAPIGAVTYSIICPEAEAQIDIDNNLCYTSNTTLFSRFGGVDFADYEEFRAASGHEKNGSFSAFDRELLIAEWEKRCRSYPSFEKR